MNPGKDCILRIKLINGDEKYIIILTEQEADNCWLLDQDGVKTCYISEADLYSSNGVVYMSSLRDKEFYYKLITGKNTIFKQEEVLFEQPQITIPVHPKRILDDADWLETANFDNIEPYQQRYRRFFFKEFSLSNPSEIKKATLYL